jgi:hypothetical protein
VVREGVFSKHECVKKGDKGRMNRFLKPWHWWLLTGCGAVLLILTVTNMVLFIGNRDSQVNINSRQQYIQQSLVFEGLNKEIINALANLAIKNRDEQIIKLLADHGVTVSVNQPTPNQNAEGGSKPQNKTSTKR